MSDDFLSRWSRRKQQARKPSDASEPIVEPVVRSVQIPGPEDLAEPVQPQAGLTAEEIDQLPKIDAFTSETDVSVFLRKGVPDALRNAALRRMWSLDPAIRDFAGHARDYAYDWNVAGGVPGTGPLGPGDDVVSMVRSIFGDTAAPAAQASEPAEDLSPARSGPVPIGSVEAPSVPARAAEAAEGSVELVSPPGEDGPRLTTAVRDGEQPEDMERNPLSARLRRHGGAKPV